MITLLILMTLHTFADFFLQTNWMASNKSRDWRALETHVFVYTLSFMAFGLKFAFITFILHFAVDAVTSRITSYFWQRAQAERLWPERAYGKFDFIHQPSLHWFFVVIGVDQLLHAYSLALTWMYLR